jgi:hypothetical protein
LSPTKALPISTFGGQVPNKARRGRLVWRCQAQTAKSYRAAEGLGFTYEGTWRRAAVVDGWQRDVAWFSLLKEEWPQRKEALRKWLSPSNFDGAGCQIQKLSECG